MEKFCLMLKRVFFTKQESKIKLIKNPLLFIIYLLENCFKLDTNEKFPRPFFYGFFDVVNEYQMTNNNK